MKTANTSNGVMWIEVDDSGGGIVIVNRYCDQQTGTGNYTKRLGADNILGHRWQIGDAGLYTQLVEVPF